MAYEKEAVEALHAIAMDITRMVVERQRAIDALTLFPHESMGAFKDIVKKVELGVLRERAELYMTRFEAGMEHAT